MGRHEEDLLLTIFSPWRNNVERLDPRWGTHGANDGTSPPSPKKL